MANDCPSYYCSDEWTDLPSALCPETFNGGISLMILLRCDVVEADLVDDEDPDALDLEKVQGLIDSDDARVISHIQVTIDAASEVTANVYDPCNPEQTINYDRTLTIVDPNVNEDRRQFWSSVNSANRFANGGALFYECDAERWTYVDTKIAISGSRVSPENNGELQRFELSAKYRSKDDAKIFTDAFEPSDLTY